MTFGTVLFWLTWPTLWLYAPLTRRVRVLIICGDEFMAVKNWFGPNKIQLPGGGITFSETPKAAAVREVQEELGITLDPEVLVELTGQPIVVKQFGLTMRYHFMFVQLRDKPSVRRAREIAQYEWLPLTETAVAPEVNVARSLAKNAILD